LKLTKSQLKRIIKEELGATLNEIMPGAKSKGVVATVKSFIPGTDEHARRDLYSRMEKRPGGSSESWNLKDILWYALPPPADDIGRPGGRDEMTIRFFAGYRKAGGDLVEAAFAADGDKAYEATRALALGKPSFISPEEYVNQLRAITH